MYFSWLVADIFKSKDAKLQYKTPQSREAYLQASFVNQKSQNINNTSIVYQ